MHVDRTTLADSFCGHLTYTSMSKELPYFRFTAAEWLSGDISLEDYSLKGLFIDVCAYYWFKDCSITKAMLKKRFNNADESLNKLFDSGIIKGSDDVSISFLDEQFELLSDSRKKRQVAGSEGGKKSRSNAKAMLKQCSSYKDKDKDKDKDNISFDVFWNLYDKKVGAKSKCEKKWNKLTLEVQQKIIDTLPAFKTKIRDIQYLPYPETYLNNQRWNDEDIQTHKIVIPVRQESEQLKVIPGWTYR